MSQAENAFWDTLEGVHEQADLCWGILAGLVERLDPERPCSYPKHLDESEWADLSWLRHEYVNLDKLDPDRREFAASQHAPVELCGFIAPSAHDLLRRLVRGVLWRVWEAVRPGATRHSSIEGPADYPRFYEDDWCAVPRCKIAYAVCFQPSNDGGAVRLTVDLLDRLHATMRQELARAAAAAVPVPLSPGGLHSVASFVPTRLQTAILDALNGRNLTKQKLADAVAAGEGRRLYKPGGIKELRALGLVDNKPGVGYFRPDAPPTSPQKGTN